jgi:small subunit ribosomal protein S6e
MKIVMSDPKSGKSWQVELPKEKSAILVGKKIGDQIEGDIVGAPGYVLELTGGSDNSGFPMRKDIAGPLRKSVLLSAGVGFRGKRKGERKRKTVRGNTYSTEIVQVNTKVVKHGAIPLDELFGKKEEKKDS